MKRQLLSALFLGGHLLVASAASAIAPDDQDQLWQQVEKENSYVPVEIQTPGLSGEINGFVLPDGRLKLYQIGTALQSQAQIVSSEFSQYSDESRYNLICDKGQARFPDIREERHRYQVQFRIFPMESDQPINVVDSRGKSWSVANLSTQFRPVEFVTPKVSISSDALVLRTGLTADKINKLLVAQMQPQSIPISGLISLDLTGYDDVACDLIEGKITIQADVGVHYDSAKLSRVTRVSENQMARIYEKVHSSWQKVEDGNAKILAGYNLAGGAHAANLDGSYFSNSEIFRLYGVLFDVQGHLKSLAPVDYAPAAQHMDQLSSGDAWAVSTYSLAIVKPSFGRKWLR